MNLANKFTMFRVLLVPIFIVFVTMDSFWTNIFALVIFVIAAITDCFDGIIARKYNLITTFGIFLDPLADKLLVTSAFISFVGKYMLNIPAWMVICIIAREFIITGLRSIAASKNIIITCFKKYYYYSKCIWKNKNYISDVYNYSNTCCFDNKCNVSKILFFNTLRIIGTICLATMVRIISSLCSILVDVYNNNAHTIFWIYLPIRI